MFCSDRWNSRRMRNPIRCDAQSNKPFLARLSGILLQIGRLRDSRAALQGSFSTGGFSHPGQNVDRLSGSRNSPQKRGRFWKNHFGSHNFARSFWRAYHRDEGVWKDLPEGYWDRFLKARAGVLCDRLRYPFVARDSGSTLVLIVASILALGLVFRLWKPGVTD